MKKERSSRPRKYNVSLLHLPWQVSGCSRSQPVNVIIAFSFHIDTGLPTVNAVLEGRPDSTWFSVSTSDQPQLLQVVACDQAFGRMLQTVERLTKVKFYLPRQNHIPPFHPLIPSPSPSPSTFAALELSLLHFAKVPETHHFV